MDELQQPSIEQPAEQTSAFSKLFNVYSEPTAVFEEVAQQEKTTMNWLLPVISVILVAIVFTFVVFSDPVIKQEMKNAQMKKLQEKVQAGKMTQEQFEKAQSFMPEPGSPIFLITGVIGIIVITFISVLLVALVMMFAGKMFFNSPVPYAKVMEVVGLAHSVFILSAIVSMLTVKIGGSLSKTPSAAFFLDTFDPGNVVHHLLKYVDVFSFWYLFVLSVGLGKLFKKSTGSVAPAVIGLWAVYAICSSLLSGLF